METAVSDWLATVGLRIRATRETAGLTLHELARLSGLSAGALSRIETGKRDLRVSSLHRIAAALRVEAAVLLGGPSGPEGFTAPGVEGYDLGDYR